MFAGFLMPAGGGEDREGGGGDGSANVHQHVLEASSGALGRRHVAAGSRDARDCDVPRRRRTWHRRDDASSGCGCRERIGGRGSFPPPALVAGRTALCQHVTTGAAGTTCRPRRAHCALQPWKRERSTPTATKAASRLPPRRCRRRPRRHRRRHGASIAAAASGCGAGIATAPPGSATTTTTTSRRLAAAAADAVECATAYGANDSLAAERAGAAPATPRLARRRSQPCTAVECRAPQRRRHRRRLAPWCRALNSRRRPVSSGR